MAELTEKTIAAIADMARSTGDPKIIQHGNIPFAVIPDGAALHSLEPYVFNEHAPAPERVKANVAVLDPDSFIEYYTLFHDANSRIFADEQQIRVVGVLDYHGAAEGGPRWCQHRVTLTLRQSEEWKIWVGRNNKQFTQMEFAEFLEQNSIDITNPAAASMVDVARDLEGKTEVEFGGGSRTDNGQIRFKYTETTKASVGSGQVEVPERFTVTIPAFIGGQRVPMSALLRYRVKEGKLVLWYTLIRPEEVMRAAFLGARSQIATSLSATIINGVPA